MMVLLLFFSQLKKLKWRGFGEKGYWVLGISYWVLGIYWVNLILKSFSTQLFPVYRDRT